MKKTICLLITMLLLIGLITVKAEESFLKYDIESYLDDCERVDIYRTPYAYITGEYGDFEHITYDNDVNVRLYSEKNGETLDELIEKLSSVKLTPCDENQENINENLIKNDEVLVVWFTPKKGSNIDSLSVVLTGNRASFTVRQDGMKSNINHYTIVDGNELIEYILRILMSNSDEQRVLVNYEGRISKMAPFLIGGTPYVSIQQIGDFLGSVISTGKNNCDLYDVYNGLGYGELWNESKWWNLLYMDRTKGMYNLYEILDAYGYSAEWDERKWCIFVEKRIAVKLNDLDVEIGSKPYIKNDRTMVPMRAIFEALGAEVSWDDETKTAIGVKDGVEVKITIGENVLYKNGEAIALDCAAEITNDRTMVPVRAISEAFGCTVEWNDETKTVEITN